MFAGKLFHRHKRDSSWINIQNISTDNGVSLKFSQKIWGDFWCKEPAQRSFSQYKFNNIFEQAVESIKSSRHIPSIFFSGGLDSTSVASMFVGCSDIKLYALAFPGDHSDEGKKQKSLSKILNLSLNSIELDEESYIEELYSSLDKSSTVSTRLGFVGVNKLCKTLMLDGKRLAYTGEGADEILFGYDLFFENVLIEKINKIDFSNFAKLYRRINSYSKDAENSLFTKLAY